MAVDVNAAFPVVSISLVDRVYARAFALAVRGESEGGAAALVRLAGGDPHVLGAARERCVLLARAQPDGAGAERLVTLVTDAYLQAVGSN